uniref:Uncharacterized protein n=1 Tax=Ditylum brightwellii TaxID=49249 RepID=A0A7S4V9V6_9STRA
MPSRSTPGPVNNTSSTTAPTYSTPVPTISTPANTTMPSRSTPGPVNNTSSTTAPTYSTPVPTYSTPAPTISTSTPTVSTPTPTYSTSTPTVSTPAPTNSTPTPTVSTPAPTVSAPTTTETLLEDTNFETGWEGWVDGGNDVRVSNFNQYCKSGQYCIRLRDNSGEKSSITKQFEGMDRYSKLKVDFDYYSRGMHDGNDFFLEINNGNGWLLAEDWITGTDFENNRFSEATVQILSADIYPSVPTFNPTIKLRFRCDAKDNDTRIYIDDITIWGYSY